MLDRPNATPSHLDLAFADTVLGAQETFRALMAAIAEPGTVRKAAALSGAGRIAAEGFHALALALCDGTTPVFLEGDEAVTEPFAAWLAFRAGAPRTDDPQTADFAFFFDDVTGIDRFSLGTDAYPDRSCTLIYGAAALDGTPGWLLSGPGIETSRDIAAGALPPTLHDERQRQADLFPRGQDLIAVNGDRLLAIPRTPRIEPMEAG